MRPVEARDLACGGHCVRGPGVPKSSGKRKTTTVGPPRPARDKRRSDRVGVQRPRPGIVNGTDEDIRPDVLHFCEFSVYGRCRSPFTPGNLACYNTGPPRVERVGNFTLPFPLCRSNELECDHGRSAGPRAAAGLVRRVDRTGSRTPMGRWWSPRILTLFTKGACAWDCATVQRKTRPLRVSRHSYRLPSR